MLGAGAQIFTAGPLCMEFSARMYEESWSFVDQGLPVDLQSRRAALSQLLCLKPSKGCKHRRMKRHKSNQQIWATSAALDCEQGRTEPHDM